MIFAIGHMEFETLQLKTGTSRETSPVGRGSLAVVDLHLVGSAEVITRSNIDVTSQQDIGSDGKMMPETFAPVIEPTECDRKSEGRLTNALRGSHLQIQGDALEMIVVCFDLSSQVACYSRKTEVMVFIEIVET